MPTKEEIRQCRVILAEIDSTIPGHYVDHVRYELDKLGISDQYTDADIRNIRLGRKRDLQVVKILKDISGFFSKTA